jgi:hypothetical protein
VNFGGVKLLDVSTESGGGFEFVKAKESANSPSSTISLLGDLFLTPAPRMASFTSSLGIVLRDGIFCSSLFADLEKLHKTHSIMSFDEIHNGIALDTLLSAATSGKTHALVMFTGVSCPNNLRYLSPPLASVLFIP